MSTISAYVCDEVEEARTERPGSSWVQTIVNVHVTGTPLREEAVAEAWWLTSREADGAVEYGPYLVEVQGPGDGLDPDMWLVSHRMQITRYW